MGRGIINGGPGAFATMQQISATESALGAAASDDTEGEIVIRGLTRAGRPFRPGDWAERLAGVAASVGADHRLHYSPLVCPITRDGVRCVVIQRALERREARLFRFLLDFARQNELEIVDGRSHPRDDAPCACVAGPPKRKPPG